MSESRADEGMLRQVYDVSTPADVRDYYDSWAVTYDDELGANGYASPRRVAEAVAELAADLAVPVLDYGCGTGMSGEALLAAGFSVLDGADPSLPMLDAARSKSIYRSLTELDVEAPRPPFPDGSYAVVTAIGLLGPGAAPLELFAQLLALVQSEGLFGVSFNDLAMEDPTYPEAIRHCVDTGVAMVEFEERGPHLPGLDVSSTVFVFRRLSS